MHKTTRKDLLHISFTQTHRKVRLWISKYVTTNKANANMWCATNIYITEYNEKQGAQKKDMHV